MDIYTLIPSYLSETPILQAWPEMHNLVRRVANRKPSDWRLPIVACQTVGVEPEQAIPIAAALACLQISIILIDDMLDADPRGEYRRIGQPAASNLASAFQAAGLEAVLCSKTASANKYKIINSLNSMMFKTALGQLLDTQNPADESSYWRVVQTKSAPFFSAALHVGALLGEVSEETIKKIQKFGQLYGEMIQIHDDLSDTMAVPANPDWIQKRSPLPILFAQLVEHPERNQFMELRKSLPDPQALAEAQNILVRCGAVSYCIAQLLSRYQVVKQILIETPLLNNEGFESLLSNLMQPVKELFKTVGIKDPDAAMNFPGPDFELLAALPTV